MFRSFVRLSCLSRIIVPRLPLSIILRHERVAKVGTNKCLLGARPSKLYLSESIFLAGADRTKTAGGGFAEGRGNEEKKWDENASAAESRFTVGSGKRLYDLEVYGPDMVVQVIAETMDRGLNSSVNSTVDWARSITEGEKRRK